MKELEYPFDNAYLLQNKKLLKKKLLNNEYIIEVKIAILCGATVGETQNILELFLLNHGIKPIFWQGHYNRYYEEAMFENSGLMEFHPDIIYIHTTNRNVSELPNPTDTIEVVSEKLENNFTKFRNIWDKLKKDLHCPIIQNNFEPLPYRIMGNADVYQPSGELNYINLLNQKMYAYARDTQGIYINDLSYEASWYGLERWFNQTLWYLYKYPFTVDAIPLVCYNIANIIKSLFGKNKKSLILDLDNTLWGGVIGDDGLENIKLGSETAEGMAYYDLQGYIKKLSQMGISLNICSKNDEETAKLGFKHPNSILTEEDFIVIKANWMNKDFNIKDIALELNISTDSMVFMDDNPVERNLVNKSIPEMPILELDSLENFVNLLDQSGFFEVTSLSFDDKNRSVYYKQNKVREESAIQFENYVDYLKSLKMVCFIEPFKCNNMVRVVQLINKTNQFNLTTKRYTFEEVEHFVLLESNITISARLQDRFGDNGIVSCLMASNTEGIMQIDLWVMSCRVFKRDLEKVLFDELIQQCKQRGITQIRGVYYKTDKNQFVEILYSSLGFENLKKEDKYTIWEYKIPKQYNMMNKVMEVKKVE